MSCWPGSDSEWRPSRWIDSDKAIGLVSRSLQRLGMVGLGARASEAARPTPAELAAAAGAAGGYR